MSVTPISRKRELKWLPVEQVIKNENNPREESAFRPEELEALRRSIRIHGILEPLIVTPYDADMFKLIEGERRWTAAKLEGTKEIPAIVVNRMTPHDEVVVMFNVHTQRMPWAVGVQLEAIKRLIESNGHMKDEELAQELGVSVATFRDRRQVLDMGEAVVASIVRGEIEYYAALRADQVAKTLRTRRPELTEKLGGSNVVRDKLLSKAKGRKGMTRELEAIRKDAAEPDVAPDDVLETYIQKKDVTLTEARRKASSLEERRAVEDITRDVLKVDGELRRFKVDLEAAPNLDELRRGLVKLIETAQNLEVKILAATMGATA